MTGYELGIRDIPIDDLVPNPRNSRTHGKRQIHQIADCIKALGFNNPILIDEAGMVLMGHARLEAARLLRLAEVPAVCLANMTAAQKRAYMIADNRLAERAGWDDEMLAVELRDLVEIDADLDVTVTGFEAAEIDLLLAPPAVADAADRLPKMPDGPPVTRPGDVWRGSDVGASR